MSNGNSTLARSPGVIEIIRDTYYWRAAPGAPKVRLGRTRVEAMAALEGARRMGAPNNDPKRQKKPRSQKVPADVWRKVRSVLYSSMKKRAAERGCALMTQEEFAAMWERAGGRCEVTGIRFRLTKIPNKVKRPWAPSVDRRDSVGEYTTDNCRLVCTAVNLAMNEWGEETLLRISAALIARAGRAFSSKFLEQSY
jgi:hypothetical protein